MSYPCCIQGVPNVQQHGGPTAHFPMAMVPTDLRFANRCICETQKTQSRAWTRWHAIWNSTRYAGSILVPVDTFLPQQFHAVYGCASYTRRLVSTAQEEKQKDVCCRCIWILRCRETHASDSRAHRHIGRPWAYLMLLGSGLQICKLAAAYRFVSVV